MTARKKAGATGAVPPPATAVASRKAEKVVLPDVLTEELAVVICGTAVGKRSEKRKAYYAGQANKFWHVLHRTGLTPRLIQPEDYELVLAYDIGLTDLVKGRSGNDADLVDGDFDVARFRKTIAAHRPAMVAFNGQEAARRALGRASLEYGVQAEKLGTATVHVLPSTSRRAAEHWDERHWVALAEAVKAFRKR